MGVMEQVKTINSAARTLLLAILVGTIGYGGYMVYREYTKQDRLVKDKEKEIEAARQELERVQANLAARKVEVQQLTSEVAEKAAEIERLETSMHLLKTDQRLAELRVLKIVRDELGKAKESTLQFVELAPTGEQLSAPKTFTLPGDIIYIDNWIVKFDDSYIERGDIERGTSLCLFRRIFSEQLMPRDGYSLDEVGMRPQAYARGGVMSDFEKKLWSEFWEFANDPEKAKAMGIRAANGEANNIKVVEDATYSVSLRASGGVSITRVDSKPSNAAAL